MQMIWILTMMTVSLSRDCSSTKLTASPRHLWSLQGGLGAYHEKLNQWQNRHQEDEDCDTFIPTRLIASLWPHLGHDIFARKERRKLVYYPLS